MRSLAGSIGRRAPHWRRGALTIAGFALVTAGAWMIYHPAGVIIGGLAVLIFEGLQEDRTT